MRRLVVAAVLLAAGCFIPTIEDGDVACGLAGECPTGLSCAADGRCRHSATDDLSVVDAFDTDAQPDLVGSDLFHDDAVSSCGGPYQQPCDGSCAAGGCPQSDECVPSGQALSSTTVCLAGASTACGGTGQPCCAENGCTASGACCVAGMCVASGTGCGTGAGNCSAGSCGSCGGAAKKCCAGGGNNGQFCVASGLTCDASMNCVTCGGPGQSCCEGALCAGGGCCDAGSNTCVANGGACGGAGVCNGGGCMSGLCGRLGQPACPGTLGCTAPSTVSMGGLCVACGGAGEPCCRGIAGGWCAEPYACNATGQCEPCGAPGQLCCSGRFCLAGNCSTTTTLCP